MIKMDGVSACSMTGGPSNASPWLRGTAACTRCRLLHRGLQAAENKHATRRCHSPSAPPSCVGDPGGPFRRHLLLGGLRVGNHRRAARTSGKVAHDRTRCRVQAVHSFCAAGTVSRLAVGLVRNTHPSARMPWEERCPSFRRVRPGSLQRWQVEHDFIVLQQHPACTRCARPSGDQRLCQSLDANCDEPTQYCMLFVH